MPGLWMLNGSFAPKSVRGSGSPPDCSHMTDGGCGVVAAGTHVAVADWGNNRISEFDINGPFARIIAGPEQVPCHCAPAHEWGEM